MWPQGRSDANESQKGHSRSGRISQDLGDLTRTTPVRVELGVKSPAQELENQQRAELLGLSKPMLSIIR